MWCFSPSVRTEPGGYEFTSQIDSHDQQRALMTYFKGKGWKRIALITTTDASGQDAEKSVTDLVKDPAFKDVTLVANEHFAPSDVSVSAQIEKIRAGNPDAIVSWATTAAGGTVFRALKQAGIDLPTAASGSNMTVQQMTDYAAFLPSKVYFGVGEWAANGDPRLTVPKEVSDQQKLFFATMKTVNVYPDSGADLGWEPVRVVADALNKLPAGADAKHAARLPGQLAGPYRRRRHLRLQEDAAARTQHRQRDRRALGSEREGMAPRQQPDRHADRIAVSYQPSAISSQPKIPKPLRHGRACPGHPRVPLKTWMPGTRPGMTNERKRAS